MQHTKNSPWNFFDARKSGKNIDAEEYSAFCRFRVAQLAWLAHPLDYPCRRRWPRSKAAWVEAGRAAAGAAVEAERAAADAGKIDILCVPELPPFSTCAPPPPPNYLAH